jgi:hypothetical protein
MVGHSDWIPTREQDLVDLATRWTVILADPAKQTAFDWVRRWLPKSRRF